MNSVSNQIMEFKGSKLGVGLTKVAKIGVPIVVVYVLYRSYHKYKANQKRKRYPKDVVILHQFPRGPRAPSVSPYSLKLETWLRMADIKYQNEFSFEFGPKGKTPWITFNGEDVADSQFCMDFVSKKFGKDLSEGLNCNEEALAWAFLKFSEESLAKVMILNRFVLEPDAKNLGFPKIAMIIMKPFILKKSKAQGYGLHSKEEIHLIGKKDLKSINDFIGNKKFLLGSKACYADASLFGVLCQLYYHERGTFYQYITNECPIIVRYINDMKEAYWPDWNRNVKESV